MVVELVRDLGIFAIFATVLGLVARYGIKTYFDTRLQVYQSELDKELQRHQAELEKEQVQFSELHTRRAEVAAELYERFVIFEEDMRALTTPIERKSAPSKEERFEAAAESGNKFLNYYMKNKIYFPSEVCDTIEELNGEMDEVHREFRIFTPFTDEYGGNRDLDRWQDNWERVSQDEVPELKRELESHFRELLGVERDGTGLTSF
jgi:uncharacterized membrane-anchored protein YhcB (DUF1043 family)